MSASVRDSATHAGAWFQAGPAFQGTDSGATAWGCERALSWCVSLLFDTRRFGVNREFLCGHFDELWPLSSSDLPPDECVGDYALVENGRAGYALIFEILLTAFPKPRSHQSSISELTTVALIS